MKTTNKKILYGLLTASLMGVGLFAIETPSEKAHGVDSWAPSGIKTAQYQLSGAMSKSWTNLSVSSVTSASGLDITINKPGVTYLAVSTEDNAGNTAIDMEVVVVGDESTNISPIKKIEYQLRGASTQGWTAYSTPFKITKEGVTTIDVRVTDEAGNIGNLTREVKLDKSAPINNGVTITLD